jgi:prepilin-type N-terminal cleavage/methylation domain-containing protein
MESDIMNKKGFTLIEVIAVIIIIGVLALVTVPAVARYITSSKNKTYISYEHNLKVAAQNKVTTCVGENDISCNLPDKDEKTVFYSVRMSSVRADFKCAES